MKETALRVSGFETADKVFAVELGFARSDM